MWTKTDNFQEKRLAIISDSCYSGKWLEVYYQRNWINKGIQVFCSCHTGKSYDWGRGKGG